MKKFSIRLLIAIAFTGLLIGARILYTRNMDPSFPLTAVHRALGQSGSTWLNTSRPLNEGDLRGRVLLLDFWTYCCINCMHILPDLHRLESEFGTNLTVIGVHSAKFDNEKDTANIRAAILRYEIEHPVVNDHDFRIWQSFGVRAWPTLVLVNPGGQLERVYSGEGHYPALREDIRALLKKSGSRVNHSELPIALERDKAPSAELSFPSKLAFDPDRHWLWISDSNHHRVVATDLKGQIQLSVGKKGEGGRMDGAFDAAQFYRPQGLLYRDNQVFVADTENHLLRKIDLSEKKVSTLAGTGQQGSYRDPAGALALKIALSSPWDLAVSPFRPNAIVIAMAGTHQLWEMDLSAGTLRVLAGNGSESIDDGIYPANSLSQPSGLGTSGQSVYFVDSETSSLRVLERSKEGREKVTTLIGTGLFDFGLKDGEQGVARMQHPLGVWADETGVYIADSYNHALRKYDRKKGRLSTLLKQNGLVEPAGLIRVGEEFFIANTNQNQILRARNLGSSHPVIEPFVLSPPKSVRTFSKKLPLLKRVERLTLQADHPIEVQLDIQSGWKINPTATSWMALFEEDSQKEHPLQREFTQKDLESGLLRLPEMKKLGKYRLQGVIYICRTEQNSVCSIESRDFEIESSSEASALTRLELHLGS